MIRIAAVGDIHLGPDNVEPFRTSLRSVDQDADVLLLAGDLTRHGELAEAELVCRAVADLDLPVVAVLGNHDHHAGLGDGITEALEHGGVTVLEGRPRPSTSTGAASASPVPRASAAGSRVRAPATSASRR